MPKKPRLRTLMDSQHVKGSETLHKSAQQYFCHIFWSLWKKISSKNSVLVVSENFRLFVNILKPDDKYFLSVKYEPLTQTIQMQLHRHQKIFAQFFSAFPESTKDFEYFETNDEPQRLFRSEIINCKSQGYLNA